MNEKLDLRLDDGKRPNSPGTGPIYILLAISIILGGLNLALMISGTGGSRGLKGDLPLERMKELALKLERRDLSEAAARIWTDYLGSPGLSGEERAKIWYRVGKLYQDTGDYDRAVEAYYRSEASAPVEEIKHELARRTTESLERLGMFAALDDELRERTDISGEDSEGEIVAEIGDWKISKSKMKRMIEDEAEMAIKGAAPGMSAEQVDREKEKMLDRMMSGPNLRQWLENFIAEELIYRRAMEQKLYEDSDYTDMSRQMERDLLVRMFLEREYASDISITSERLKAYYEAHKEEFKGEDGDQKSFDEARGQVYARLRMEEESRVQKGLMEDLMNRYNVVIHNSKLGGEE